MAVCNVLAVIGSNKERAEATLAAAVELADRENARLTIARTCNSPGAYVWVTPFGCGAAYVDPQAESPEQACRAVALLARTVPNWIPVTTLVLDKSTEKGLLRLIAGGQFGAVVAEAALLSRCKRLRRRLAEEEMLSIPVPVPAAGAPAQSVPGADRSDFLSGSDGLTLAPGAGAYASPGAPVPIR